MKPLNISLLLQVVEMSKPDYVEPFQTKMSTYLKDAKVNLKDLKVLVEECNKKFIATMRFLSFKPRDCKLADAQPKDFFCIWSPFCTDYKNAWKKEQAKVSAELLKAERQRLSLRTEKMRNFTTKPIQKNGLKERMLARKKNRDPPAGGANK